MRVSSLDVVCPKCHACEGQPCSLPSQYGKLRFHIDRWIEAIYTYKQAEDDKSSSVSVLRG